MPISTRQLSCVQARTKAAILAATASVLAVNRTATLPEIATAAGVGRTTLHRYFADRERLVYEATMDSIGVLTGVVNEAAIDKGPAIDAMRRVITALVSVGDRLVFLFGDPNVLRNIPSADQPNDDVIMRLIERGQREGSFDPELSAVWIENSLFGLLLKGCEGAGSGEFHRHTVAPLIIRTFERGICTPR
jgi:AcrR family transcriptional regulator